MCQSMVNIQSPTAEIRRGKKRKKKKERKNSMKIYMVSLLHRATINQYKVAHKRNSARVRAGHKLSAAAFTHTHTHTHTHIYLKGYQQDNKYIKAGHRRLAIKTPMIFHLRRRCVKMSAAVARHMYTVNQKKTWQFVFEYNFD